jgi:hypothetical protein
MIVLKEHEICQYSVRCPYAQNCWGTRPERENTFTCEFVNKQGQIRENCFRNPLDKTGKMKVIMENA